MIDTKYRNLLFAILGIKVIIILGILAFYPIPLAPDEAQYWVWSRKFSFGYYSKPPGIAWSIALTSKFLGNTAFGVRFSSIVFAFGFGLTLYYLALYAKLSQKAAFWTAIIGAFSPLGFYLSIAATTDPGSIFFLTLALTFLCKGIQNDKIPYPTIGLCLLFGGLFKWTVFIFWPILFVSAYFFKVFRKDKEALLAGICISLLAFIPPLLWNMNHDFVTFKHAFFSLAPQPGRIAKPGNFPSFLGAQVGMISPVFFLIALFAVVQVFSRRYRHKAHLFTLGCYPLCLAGLAFLSLFKKIQPNWGAFLYGPLFLLTSWSVWNQKKMDKIKWLYGGFAVSLLSIAALFLIPAAQKNDVIRWMKFPYKMNPFRQSVGVDQLTWIVRQSNFNPKTDFLFAETYQTTSHLHFYAPFTKRVYFFNLRQRRLNQYSFTPSMKQEIGRTGYFVAVEHFEEPQTQFYQDYYVSMLKPYFSRVIIERCSPIYRAYGEPVKYTLVIRCENYNGVLPETPCKF